MSNKITRRNFFTYAASAATVGLPFITNATTSDSERKRSLRIAHLTDIHVRSGKAERGMIKALHHVQNLEDTPDVIFNGGDAIGDALYRDKANTQAQWNVWNDVLKKECSLPVYHCIGNHDVWGWGLHDDNLGQVQRIKENKLYGKQWAIEEFRLSGRYYSFDKAGWHFIVLDSTRKASNERSYLAKLDEEQFEWLKKELNSTPSNVPVCVLSHIPIHSFSAFFLGKNEESGNWRVPASWMHIDARRIKDLFFKHKNVKVCLSGHTHLQDEVEYAGVKYWGNGAVSGGWWGGAYQEFPPAYAVIDLYEDGSSERTFYAYNKEA